MKKKKLSLLKTLNEIGEDLGTKAVRLKRGVTTPMQPGMPIDPHGATVFSNPQIKSPPTRPTPAPTTEQPTKFIPMKGQMRPTATSTAKVNPAFAQKVRSLDAVGRDEQGRVMDDDDQNPEASESYLDANLPDAMEGIVEDPGMPMSQYFQHLTQQAQEKRKSPLQPWEQENISNSQQAFDEFEPLPGEDLSNPDASQSTMSLGRAIPEAPTTQTQLPQSDTSHGRPKRKSMRVKIDDK